MSGNRPTVLILGAGINGCALARELLLNGVSVVLVDEADICSGATAYASRLIHGGLRYLEYGELDLVRESLAERTRLLRLAPQFVRPLRLFIPVARRTGGLIDAARRFIGWEPGTQSAPSERGLWLVRAGLTLYDAYAQDRTLPKHAVYAADSTEAIAVDRNKYRWECAYYDAQIEFPERFVLALLEDARRLALASGSEFRLLTYHSAIRHGTSVEVRARPGVPATCDERPEASNAALRIEPAAIVNATGAWVDSTLEQLQIPAPLLMAGTKGSHIFTFHSGLRSRLGGRGLYAEATDGRPIFITPLAQAVLIGTTDIPFHGCPADATASAQEIDYLLASANRVLSGINLAPRDVAFHYSGVRPLPKVSDRRPAAITRRHWVERHAGAPPVYSIIGGKLTTCRSLAENAAATILDDLKLPVSANSRERTIPGGEHYPSNPDAVAGICEQIAARSQLPYAAVERTWSLFGTRAPEVLSQADCAGELLPGVPLPCALVRWVIRQEWVKSLDDLVERRLMLLFEPDLNRDCLGRLAELLAEEGVGLAGSAEIQVESTVHRIKSRYGRQVD